MKLKLVRDARALDILEAAITMPIALLFMVAIFNLGLVVAGQQLVEAAARHGARMGSVAQDCGGCYAASAARSNISKVTFLENASVAVLAPGGRAGSILRIQVTANVPNFMAPLGAVIPGVPTEPFNVSAQTTFRQEGWQP